MVHLSAARRPRLTGFGVTPGNAGDYDVVVTNVAGSVTSVVATLTVKLIVDPNLEKAVGCALTNQSWP